MKSENKDLMPNINDNRITIYPEKELREKIEKEAKKKRQYMSGFVLTILEKYFEKELAEGVK